MRNDPSITASCRSIDPGHCLDPHSGAEFPIRNENWVPARIRVVVEYKVGMVVMVYVEGIRKRFFAHDLFAIHRLNQPARTKNPGGFGTLFNEGSQVIAIPSGCSGDSPMACFSVSPNPLTACTMEHDAALALEFERVTAGLQRG